MLINVFLIKTVNNLALFTVFLFHHYTPFQIKIIQNNFILKYNLE